MVQVTPSPPALLALCLCIFQSYSFSRSACVQREHSKPQSATRVFLEVFKKSKLSLPPSVAITFVCASRPRRRCDFQLLRPLSCHIATFATESSLSAKSKSMHFGAPKTMSRYPWFLLRKTWPLCFVRMLFFFQIWIKHLRALKTMYRDNWPNFIMLPPRACFANQNTIIKQI